MDAQSIIKKQYDTRNEVPGITTYKCLGCGKVLLLRQGSAAVTRLLSHLNTHGLVLPGTK